MKKHQLNCIFLLAVMVVLAMVQGCITTKKANDVNRVSYQVLETSKATYDLLTDGINDLYKQKLITDANYVEIEKYADNYMEAHNMAVEVVKAFKVGLISADEASNQVAAVTASLTALLRVAQPYILKLGKEK